VRYDVLQPQMLPTETIDRRYHQHVAGRRERKTICSSTQPSVDAALGFSRGSPLEPDAMKLKRICRLAAPTRSAKTDEPKQMNKREACMSQT
jgi:hypothetical protein